MPATVRLIDPPLHEFLPSRETLIEEVAALKARGQSDPRRRSCSAPSKGCTRSTR
jgi:pyruvate,orthophosphate dikinase